jgi:hypothetical protein
MQLNNIIIEAIPPGGSTALGIVSASLFTPADSKNHKNHNKANKLFKSTPTPYANLSKLAPDNELIKS